MMRANWAAVLLNRKRGRPDFEALPFAMRAAAEGPAEQ
jgi:hypothetical protein